jgi:N,N'-diacetyl-8-epilegionaminate cytidylyltransferase
VTEKEAGVIGFIFARGGSKSIPRKNLALVGGVSLLQHAIETALASKWIQRVVVSTDDQEIAKNAIKGGAEVPFMRPNNLAEDNSSEWKAWQHSLQNLSANKNFPKIDVFVCIPTTSPLRNHSDIDRCIDLLLNSNADIIVTATETSRHPSFNMIHMETDEEVANLVMPTKNPVVNRQTVPSRVYDLTTVAYVSRPEYILRAKSIFEGTVRAVVIPPERAVDIDNPLDLAFAEFLLTRNTL